MEKLIKEKPIFETINFNEPVKIKDIKVDLQPDDIIQAGFEHPFESENNALESHWYLRVIRKVLETDEEFEKRKAEEEALKKRLKKRRYENYLKLKKEFDE